MFGPNVAERRGNSRGRTPAIAASSSTDVIFDWGLTKVTKVDWGLTKLSALIYIKTVP